MLNILDEIINGKTRALLQYLGFLAKSVDEAWYLLEWIAWDSFEFEQAACSSGYSLSDPCVFYARSYYSLFWCYLCNSSNHETNLCSYYAGYDQSDFASLGTRLMLS